MIDIPVAILCGGQGTRLGALTEHTPKSLVKVAGKPFIFHQLDLLVERGVKKVVLCIGHLGEQIVAAVGNDYHGIAIHYSRDGDKPLGTMEAVRRTAPLLGHEFLTLYGDSYLPSDWEPFISYARSKDAIVAQTMWRGDDYGLSYFGFGWLDATRICSGIGELHNLRVCYEYEMLEKFYQIGDPNGLAEVETLLAPKPSVVMPPASPTVIPPNAVFTNQFLLDVIDSARSIDSAVIERIVSCLSHMREGGGRLVIIGIGGSSANASHAVNDFRKLCCIEAYAPTDNVSEITARTNDDGWATVFKEWLKQMRPRHHDVLLVLSVGGGTAEVSRPIVEAIDYARKADMTVVGIVGPNGGHTAKHADYCLKVPVTNPKLVTPITESFQSLVLHLIVSHPKLQCRKTMW